jgi:hypothetical protein
MRAINAFLGFALFSAGLTTGQAAAPAQGHVALEKQNWDVVDAIAYRHDDEVLVVLSNKNYDRAAFAKDGKLDDFDFIHHTMDAGASTLTLKFDDEFKLSTMQYSLPGGSGARSGDMEKDFTLGKHSATALAGAFKYASDADKVSVSFDLPIQSDKLERPGKPLAADGGDPGKALLKHFAAIQSGNIDQVIAVSPPERRSMIEAAKASGEAKQMLPFMQSMTPTQAKVLGGTLDGDKAQIDFQGMLGGKVQKGNAELSRINGTWYVGDVSLDAQ